MLQFTSRPCSVIAAVAMTGLLAWPAVGAAQEVSGQGTAVRSTVAGVTSVIADTGTLVSEEDARGTSKLTGSISSLGTADTLHATTISSVYGWDSEDYVHSAASLGNVDLSLGSNAISADFVLAEALAPVGGSNTGTSQITGLTVNGMAIDVTGEPNQTIPLVGGQIVINEQQTTSSGDLVVNALHITVDGVADVVLGSATAGVDDGTSSDSDGGLLSDTTSTLGL